jgi:transposase
MQDKQLYAQILGIQEPWYVDRVELQLEKGSIHIYLEHHSDGKWRCVECDRECALHDHQEERQWRHLDTCQYQTVLHAKPPRTHCPDHGARVVSMPWALPNSRFTALFERIAIEFLLVASQAAMAARLGLSWDEIHGIQERAVKRGLERRKQETVAHLGVDEKSFRKGHRYLTLVNDLDRGRVLFVSEDRKQGSLDQFWLSQTAEQIHAVEAIAMDMWDPYVASTREHLPAADQKIVFDKFHVSKLLGEAVDKVRRAENRDLIEQGDPSLVKTKYLWLRNPKNFTDAAWRRFGQLRRSLLQTAKAWAIKESVLRLYEFRYKGAARNHFQRCWNWAIRCRLEPMQKAVATLRQRLSNILTYLDHPITNATSESINSKIQWIKYTARGFRNYTNFVNAIYFHCGGLNLMP